MDAIDGEKLAENDGQEGKAAWIAYAGKVYDVSESLRWKMGKHMMRHSAGHDLTVQLKAAPHGPEVFERVRQVGILAMKAEVEEPKIFWPLKWIYKKFPFIKRHGHPMVVHFPIAFVIGSSICNLIFWLTESISCEKTSFHMLLFGLIFLPLSILTGIQSWWLFYGLKKTSRIIAKLIAAPVLTLLSGFLIYVHLINPDIVSDHGAKAVVYSFFLAICVPLVGLLGYIGARMTFPD